MRYIWEAFQSEKYEDKFIKQSEIYSPEMEITERMQNGEEVFFNSYLRYGKVMTPLRSIQESNKSEYDVFFDLFARLLIESDLQQGLSVKNYVINKNVKAMLEGDFGRTVAQLMTTLNEQERYNVCYSVSKAMASGKTDIYHFADAIAENLGRGIVYKDKDHPQKIVIYVGKKKNSKDEKLIKLLSCLLLPMEYTYVVLWEKHFGVLDNEETMRIGTTVLI